jgi:type VI secretion system secreted protein VgrG
MPSQTTPAANVSRYGFDPAELDPSTFQVVRFQGSEGLSELFTYDVQLVSEDPDIDFSKVVNKKATFTMKRGGEDLPVNGIVTDFSLTGHTADYVTYRATLQPRLQRLALSHRSRIFQEMTVKDILKTVFEEDGLSSSDVKFQLQESYSQREYCVQYEESDLNFVNRLMEFEGMYYFFKHEGGTDTLVITDKKSEHETIPAPSTLRYDDDGGGMVEQDLEVVKRFSCEEQVVTGTVKLRDYNYRTPETMTTESQMNGEMPGTRYEYGENFRKSGRGKRLAEVRNEALEARRRVMRGESDSVGLRSGFLFTLEKHFRKSFNADYLVTHIEHEGSQRAGLDVDALPSTQNGESEPDYRNEFTCIPASVQYRPPRRTPKPEVPGVLTATIESAGGDYAYIDDQGRYRAQMHFDQRGDRSDGTKTLPLRMNQPYSGSDYGMHFPNHADTEMLVAFENGDIDRPIALGTTPNPSNKSPSVSQNKMENLLRTWGGNELLMDDTKDEARVRLQSSNAHTLLFDDKKEKIELLSTDQHKVLLDDKNKRLEIQSKEGRKILLDDDNKVMSIVSKTGHFVDISDENDVITVSDADENHVLTLDYNNEKMSIETTGDIGFTAEGAIEMESESLSIQTNKGAELQVGGDLTQDADGNVALSASKSASVEATEALDLSGREVAVESQTSLAAEGGTTTELKGTQLKVEGSTMAEVKGATLKLNG